MMREMTPTMTSVRCRIRDALVRATGSAVALLALTSVLPAQTDYYNTSAGRPLRIEDALPVEYRGVELDLAPLRWESARERSLDEPSSEFLPRAARAFSRRRRRRSPDTA